MIFVSSRIGLVRELTRVRARLERIFAADTSNCNDSYRAGSSDGHCAVVALLLHELLGGEFVSASVGGISHWFNRLSVPFDEDCDEWIDFDLTGDQFDRPAVNYGEPNLLFGGTRARSEYDINAETRARYEVLRVRFGLEADWSSRDAAGSSDGGGAA